MNISAFLTKSPGCGCRIRALLAACLLVCVALLGGGCKRTTQEEPVGPAETVVYLRGTFNNWDLSVPMEYSQQYGYLATLDCRQETTSLSLPMKVGRSWTWGLLAPPLSLVSRPLWGRKGATCG